MALQMRYQSVIGGSFTNVDLTADRIVPLSVKFSDSHPAVFEFAAIQPQHTLPIPLRAFVQIWDDAGTTPDSTAQSSSNPLFEGFVWEAQPAESNLVKYVAYDPSHLAGREVTVMSTAWDGGVEGNPPLPGLGAVPRLIMNSAIDNDVDYAFERSHGLTVGDMIELVLDDALYPLRWYAAAPGADVAYQTSDMATFEYQPQEKIVSTNESIRSFVDRLTSQHYPEFAFRWDPGSRYWRWYSRLAGTARTLTLNKPDEANLVLTMELHRSMEGRYPAVQFYGPETAGPNEYFSTLAETLSIIDAGVTLETYTDIHGSASVVAHYEFQITDPDKRRGAKRLPTTELVRENDYFIVGTQSPMFEISYDYGDTWQAVESYWFDFQHGIATIPVGLWPFFWSDHELVAGSTQHFWVPNAYRMIWAPYTDPITVRRPTSGYSGTSNTVANSTAVLAIYDEMLAVGYSRAGTPVTTASRIAQFEILGDAILAARKDIIYTGGCVLDGLKYDFCRMERNVNIAAVDEDGDDITTGWEEINASVSDVEYNFADQTTTLTFSQEALTAWGDNADLLKQRLRVGYVQKIRDISIQYQWGTFDAKFSWGDKGHYQAWVGLTVTDRDLFYDANTGRMEAAL